MPQERAKEALGSILEHFGTDFGFNFGSISIRFATSRHLGALQATISASIINETRHTVHKHMFVWSIQHHDLHEQGERNEPDALIGLYQLKHPIKVVSISPCIKNG